MKRIDWDALMSVVTIIGMVVALLVGASLTVVAAFGFVSVVLILFAIKDSIDRLNR